MKLQLPYSWAIAALLTTALFCHAGAARAQSAPAASFEDCPPFPSQFADIVHWEHRQIPGMLFCRALLADGTEAFALTVSAESPFKPRRGLREETSTLGNGHELIWYRAEIIGQTSMLGREALVQLAPDRVAHLSMRAPDADTLSKFESYAASLPYPDYTAD